MKSSGLADATSLPVSAKTAQSLQNMRLASSRITNNNGGEHKNRNSSVGRGIRSSCTTGEERRVCTVCQPASWGPPRRLRTGAAQGTSPLSGPQLEAILRCTLSQRTHMHELSGLRARLHAQHHASGRHGAHPSCTPPRGRPDRRSSHLSPPRHDTASGIVGLGAYETCAQSRPPGPSTAKHPAAAPRSDRHSRAKLHDPETQRRQPTSPGHECDGPPIAKCSHPTAAM
jgi:hypothetical protein